MPSALHGELAQAAEREGVSLNQLIVGRLAQSVATPETQEALGEPPPRERRRSSRLLTYALGANIVVLLAAAAIALALLLAAWRA
jgi:hypothetical protein